ncbi:hypothetical protein MKW92_049305, partial [Papaver armeniacum]
RPMSIEPDSNRKTAGVAQQQQPKARLLQCAYVDRLKPPNGDEYDSDIDGIIDISAMLGDIDG